MKYHLAKPTETAQAYQYLAQLAEKQAVVEIKKVSPKRSLKQNAYLHLIIAAFGAHFGYTAEEAKLVYKDVNADIYKYTKKNRTFYRSSADITTEDMTKSIDRFREASAQQGYPLPLATDQDWLRHIENEIERTKHFM